MAKKIPRSSIKTTIAVLIAGPNGAGKSTVAPRLLEGALRVKEFLNADLIAKGISPFDPNGAAVAAGKIMLQRMAAFAKANVSFGLETTLAARTLAPRLQSLISIGYEFHLVYLYLRSADLAVARVADRVRMGGHDVPEQTIRRRYRSVLENFFTLYHPLATTWQMFDNSRSEGMKLIATGRKSNAISVPEKRLWAQIKQKFAS